MVFKTFGNCVSSVAYRSTLVAKPVLGVNLHISSAGPGGEGGGVQNIYLFYLNIEKCLKWYFHWDYFLSLKREKNTFII